MLGLILKFRHYLYDKGIKKSYKFTTPTICVGNITVGGTGKTPHIELLINILKKDHKIAVVSRGYKRKSKGYREVQADDNYLQVGDEPLQIKRKFPDVIVVVDKDRKRAIETLEAMPYQQKPTLILLDDAFQHRRIVPTLSILLINSLRPIHKDRLLPFGKLRDLPSRSKTADIVILTKLDSPNEEDLSKWETALRLPKAQTLLFSKTKYMDILPIFPEENDSRYIYSQKAILFSGIASSTPFERYVSSRYKIDNSIDYPDHHDFSRRDIKKLEKIAEKKSPLSIILTTEKDAQRLKNLSFISDKLKRRMFYVPIEAEMIPNADFSKKLLPSELAELGREQLYKAIHSKL